MSVEGIHAERVFGFFVIGNQNRFCKSKRSSAAFSCLTSNFTDRNTANPFFESGITHFISESII